MKRLTIVLLSVLLLTGCIDGLLDYTTGQITGTVSTLHTVPLPPDSRALYDAAGGNKILMTINAPLVTTSVFPVYNGSTGITTVLANQCAFSYDLTALAGANATYFASQPMEVIYDATSIQCGSTVGPCDYVIGMVGTVAEATLTCVITNP